MSPPGTPARTDDSKSISSPSLRTPVMLLHAITSVWTAGRSRRLRSSKPIRALWYGQFQVLALGPNGVLPSGARSLNQPPCSRSMKWAQM